MIALLFSGYVAAAVPALWTATANGMTLYALSRDVTMLSVTRSNTGARPLSYVTPAFRTRINAPTRAGGFTITNTGIVYEYTMSSARWFVIELTGRPRAIELSMTRAGGVMFATVGATDSLLVWSDTPAGVLLGFSMTGSGGPVNVNTYSGN